MDARETAVEASIEHDAIDARATSAARAPALHRVASPPWAIALLLALLAVAVHLDVLSHELLNYDDDDFLLAARTTLEQGLGLDGLRWAFTTRDAGNWVPLVRVSWLADVTLFGFRPIAFHTGNLFWHALATALLFLALHAATRARAPSAIVAALFAVHPVHVESVAWAAERRDVLCGALWAATLCAHVAHARRPGALRLAVTTLACAGALLAKPTAVTLPFVLLLFDVWPLGRFDAGQDGAARARRALVLVAEKLPMLILVAGTIAMTLRAQSEAGSIVSTELYPLAVRIANAPLALVTYLRQLVWPVGLAPFYPHPGEAVSRGAAAMAALLLAVASGALLAASRRRPWLGIGWLLFLGMLVPVIGLVQVGAQAHADRYLYLPLAGIAIAVVWEAAAVCERAPRARVPALGLALAAIAALAAVTIAQTRHWRTSRTLFEHTLAVTEENWIAHGNLGAALLTSGDATAASAQFREATRIRPSFHEAWAGLGEAELAARRPDAAQAAFARALAIAPARRDVRVRLGQLLAERGRDAEALQQLEIAHAQGENGTGVRAMLGQLLLRAGRAEQAVPHLCAAVEALGDAPQLRGLLGIALVDGGRLDEAAPHLEAAGEMGAAAPAYAIALARVREARGDEAGAVAAHRAAIAAGGPGLASAQNNLAWLLATARDPAVRDAAEAVRLAEAAAAATQRSDAAVLDTLSAACEAAGRRDDALRVALEALHRAETAGPPALVPSLRERITRLRGAH